MSRHAVEPGMAEAYVEQRRGRIRDALRHPLEPAGAGAEPLDPARLDHLRREAEELYWNELSWEQLTDEEAVAGGRLIELAFPAFLAFIDGLLPRATPAGPRPHPDVVEEILLFLAQQYLQFTVDLERGADSQRIVWARAMTVSLIDLVLYRVYQLTPEECEQIDGG